MAELAQGTMAQVEAVHEVVAAEYQPNGVPAPDEQLATDELVV